MHCEVVVRDGECWFRFWGPEMKEGERLVPTYLPKTRMLDARARLASVESCARALLANNKQQVAAA